MNAFWILRKRENELIAKIMLNFSKTPCMNVFWILRKKEHDLIGKILLTF